MKTTIVSLAAHLTDQLASIRHAAGRITLADCMAAATAARELEKAGRALGAAQFALAAVIDNEQASGK